MLAFGFAPPDTGAKTPLLHFTWIMTLKLWHFEQPDH
jgi:hypothetical protein